MQHMQRKVVNSLTTVRLRGATPNLADTKSTFDKEDILDHEGIKVDFKEEPIQQSEKTKGVTS